MFERLKELFRKKEECIGKDVCKIKCDEALLAYCKELEKKIIRTNLNPDPEFMSEEKPVRSKRDMGIENRLRITITELQKTNARLAGEVERLKIQDDLGCKANFKSEAIRSFS